MLLTQDVAVWMVNERGPVPDKLNDNLRRLAGLRQLVTDGTAAIARFCPSR